MTDTKDKSLTMKKRQAWRLRNVRKTTNPKEKTQKKKTKNKVKEM